MNWLLVALLTLPGVGMGLASTVSSVERVEAMVWMLTALSGAALIGCGLRRRWFRHGFAAGFCCAAVTALIQVLCFDSFLAHNRHVAEVLQQSSVDTPRLYVLFLTPFVAGAYGLLIGILSWSIGKLVPRRSRVVKVIRPRNHRIHEPEGFPRYTGVYEAPESLPDLEPRRVMR